MGLEVVKNTSSDVSVWLRSCVEGKQGVLTDITEIIHLSIADLTSWDDVDPSSDPGGQEIKPNPRGLVVVCSVAAQIENIFSLQFLGPLLGSFRVRLSFLCLEDGTL